MRSSARQRIAAFLRDHPDGTLLVAVGYASAAGLAWLNQVTQGRPVKLLIGNAQKQYWKNISSKNARAAAAFIRREDTEVRNWYRTAKSGLGEAEAHLKVWVVQPGTDQQAALVGSANLTNQGLDRNIEALVEAHGPDLQDVSLQVRDLWVKAWDQSDRLLAYLTESQTPAATTWPRSATRSKPPYSRGHRGTRSAGRSGTSAEPPGCLPVGPGCLQVGKVAALICAALIGLSTLAAIFSGGGAQNSGGPPEGVLSEQAVVESARDLL